MWAGLPKTRIIHSLGAIWLERILAARVPSDSRTVWFCRGSCEEIREGEAPAEPPRRKFLIQKGSAEASPSRDYDQGHFFTPSLSKGFQLASH